MGWTMTTAERQRAFRERQKAKGLVPVTVYVRKDDAGKVKEFAAELAILITNPIDRKTKS